MGVTLDEEGGFDIGAVVFAFGVFVYADGDAMGDFVFEDDEGGFADEIGGDVAFVEIGDLIFWVEWGTFGKHFDDFFGELGDAKAFAGGDGDALGGGDEGLVFLDVGGELGLIWDEIELVDDEEYGGGEVGFVNGFGDDEVSFLGWGAGVYEEEDEVVFF